MKIKRALHIIILLAAIYLGYIFTNIVVPRVQVFLDLANYNSTGTVESFIYNDKYHSLTAGTDGRYYTEYEVYGRMLNISFSVTDNMPSNIKVNDQDFTKIEKISDYSSASEYASTFALKTNVTNIKYYLTFVLLTIVFLISFEFILNRVIFGRGFRIDKFIYSKSGLENIGKKTILISYIVTAVSLIIYHGCDLQPITDTLHISSAGVDIYQLFACLNKYKEVDLFVWQYEGVMLAFYKFINFVNYLPFKYNEYSYHWGYTILYKFVNITMLNLTAISLVSFLLDHNIITKEKSKRIYLWSVLNPVTFYVSVIFIQLDALPLYFITLGILLLDNIEENKILPFILVAFGLTCKIPVMMCLPVIGVVGIYLLLKEKNIRIKLIGYFIFFAIMMFVLFLAPRVVHSPMQVAYKDMVATQRMWWTTIQYAPVVFLFITVMIAEIFFILNYTKLTLNVSIIDLIQNSLFIIATIVFGFSFSVMSTPGIYIITMPAFALMYARQEDNLQRFIFGFGGLLMVVYVLFTSIGDISATSVFFGGKKFFTEIEHMYSGTSTGTWINSFVTTVSNSAMLAYAIVFFKEAGKHFKKHKKVEEN